MKNNLKLQNKKILEITKKLIKYKTTNNNYKEIEKCIDFIENIFKNYHSVDIKRYNFNNYPSIVISNIKNNYYFDYILNGHIDVVPSNNPYAFKPKIENNRLYGRGAMDMKSQVAVMSVVMQNVLENRLNKKIALMITSDEEIGGFSGTGYLVEKQKYRAKCVVLPDDGFYNKITLEEKGVIHIKIITKGKSAHGSRPWLGENAIEKAIEIFKDIKKIFPANFDENKWINTLNLGKFYGGIATNVIPDQAELYLDIRFIKKNDKKEIIKKIKNILKKFEKTSFEILVEGYPLINKKNNLYIKKFLKIGLKNKIKFSYHYGHGASDARFFAKYNIPVIMWRPKSSEAHIDNEWVDIKSLEKYYLILKDFIFN